MKAFKELSSLSHLALTAAGRTQKRITSRISSRLHLLSVGAKPNIINTAPPLSPLSRRSTAKARDPLTVNVILDDEGRLGEGLAAEQPDRVPLDDGGVGGAAGRHVLGRREGGGRQQLPEAPVLHLAAVRA